MARILVVEDDARLASLVKDMLEAKGFDVATAPDGQAGVEAARHDPPDLILLDIMMPRMNGIDACRALKADEKTRKVKIVMMTALGRVTDVESAFSAGANDYLIKPFQWAALFSKIDAALKS